MAKITLSYNPDSSVKTRNFIGFTNNQSGVVQQDNVIQNMVYDLSGQAMYSNKTVTYSDGRKYSFSSDKNVYDEAGNLFFRTDALGQEEEFSYDEAGRLSEVAKFDQFGTIKNERAYSYDKNGNPTKMEYEDLQNSRHGSGWINYEYYPNNLQKSIADATSNINYEYYLDGSLKTIKYSDGKSKNHILDSYGRVIETQDESGALTQFHYNSQGLLDSQSHKGDRLTYTYGMVNHVNGGLVAVNLVGQSTFAKNYTYNGMGKISKESVINPQGSVLLNSLYKYDELGRMKNLEKSSTVSSDSSVNLQRSFWYDGLSQLKEESTSYPGGQPSTAITYNKYDGKGNVLTKTDNGVVQHYVYNEIDQIVSSSAIKYDYAGRMTRDDQGFRYLYNGLDQLIRITDTTGKVVCDYNYYPDGLLMTRSDATTAKRYYYQGAGTVNSVLATDKTKNTDIWKTFLFEGQGSRVSEYTAQKSPSYYLTTKDSTSAIMKDGVLQGLDYDPYGKIKSTVSTSQIENPNFLWDQEYQETTTGLVYLRSRFYNPRLMRFMTADSYPVENKYSFGNADPINMIDPSGHLSIAALTMDIVSIIAGIGGIIAAIPTGGISLTVSAGLAIAGGVIGVASGATGVAADVTGNKGCAIASTVLGVAGGVVDGAALARHSNLVTRIMPGSNNKIFTYAGEVDPYDTFNLTNALGEENNNASIHLLGGTHGDSAGRIASMDFREEGYILEGSHKTKFDNYRLNESKANNKINVVDVSELSSGNQRTIFHDITDPSINNTYHVYGWCNSEKTFRNMVNYPQASKILGFGYANENLYKGLLKSNIGLDVVPILKSWIGIRSSE